MRKRLWKKALTVMLAAAVMLSNVGMASVSAETVKRVPVEGVYTNIQKATMAIGTTRQIKAYVEPSNATNQKVTYQSSNDKVATVSGKGLITAVGAGSAVITVKAADSSGQYEIINITVQKDRSLAKKNVDKDNEIVVLDKKYGNVNVASGVGKAKIYWSNITVRNRISLEQGDYSISMLDTTTKELILGSKQTEATKGKTPEIILKEGTKIQSLTAKISSKISQLAGSQVDNFKIAQDVKGNITIELTGYNGPLVIDSELGDITIIATDSKITDVKVEGKAGSGKVAIKNGGDSSIENLVLTGAAQVELRVPAGEVTLDKSADKASLTVASEVGSLEDKGNSNKIGITGEVETLTISGKKSSTQVEKGAFVGQANLNGEGAVLGGEGEVAEAYVNANNVSVNTTNTLLVVGKVSGTKMNGASVAAGQSVTTYVPVPPTPTPEPPKVNEEEIFFETFESGSNPFTEHPNNVTVGKIRNGGTVNIVDGGYESNKALKLEATADWNGIGYKFDMSDHLERREYRVTARIKKVAGANGSNLRLQQQKQIADGGWQYIDLGSIVVSENEWTELDVTFKIGGDSSLANFVIIAPSWVSSFATNGLNAFYVDDFKIVEIIPEDVEPNEGATEIKIDFSEMEEGDTYRMLAWSPGETAVIEDGVLKVAPAGYNRAAVVPVTLPAGVTLGDYESAIVNIKWVAGDVRYKEIVMEADATLSSAFNNNSDRKVGGVGNNISETDVPTDYREYTIELNDKKADLTGNIEIAIGIHCSNVHEVIPGNTLYYIKDITLVPKQ